MKKIMKKMLVGVGIVSAGFIAYTLWDDYIQNEIRQKEKADAEKRAEYIARRKAHAQAKRESRAAENMEQTVPPSFRRSGRYRRCAGIFRNCSRNGYCV